MSIVSVLFLAGTSGGNSYQRRQRDRHWAEIGKIRALREKQSNKARARLNRKEVKALRKASAQKAMAPDCGRRAAAAVSAGYQTVAPRPGFFRRVVGVFSRGLDRIAALRGKQGSK